ncbi:MAG: TonB-dependent receptor plug domain-containing protein, partial [Bacteroidota bacterium]
MKKNILSICFLPARLRFILLIAGWLLVSVSFSQWQGNGGGGNMKEMKTGILYGKVVDSTAGKGVEYASVQLLSNMFDTVTKAIKKNVVIAGQLTKENGDFSLEKINVLLNYNLKIVAMGYETKEIRIAPALMDKDLGNIKLKPQATQLKAVEIISTAPVMELKLDKKVFNVGKNMIATGGTAEDVLKQVPSVSVDIDGNISLRNASPQLFVDGKPTTLTIDQIPADAIQSVEVITNPSAKYDASGGQGGILNIVLKKDRRIGYNGNVRAGIDHRGKISSGADINARENKINVFISGIFNQRHSITEGITQRKNLIGNPLTTIFQDNYSVSNGYFSMARGGIDWFMNNRNTFTFSGNYVNGKFLPFDSLRTKTDTIDANNSTSYNRISETGRQWATQGGSLQYKHLFPKEGKELTADLNYSKISIKGWGDYTTNYSDAAGNSIGTSILQKMAS